MPWSNSLQEMEQPKINHNILFTLPRTASHLLTRLLHLPAQSSITRPPNGEDGYLFLPACLTRFKRQLFGKEPNSWTDEDKQALKDALQKGFNDWTDLISEAEQSGKGTYIKEHINFL